MVVGHYFLFLSLGRCEIQAVLDGVPPTGLQLLRRERVLLMLWIKGPEHLEKWSKIVAHSGAPPEDPYEKWSSISRSLRHDNTIFRQ